MGSNLRSGWDLPTRKREGLKFLLAVQLSGFLDAAWWQKILTGHNLLAGLRFQFQAGTFGNFATSLRSRVSTLATSVR